jgi:fructose-bisphosphate aldolase class 1
MFQDNRTSAARAVRHRRTAMTEDDFNISLRRFLKQVGITSQQEIERVVRERALTAEQAGSLRVRAVLTAEGTELQHVVEGEITLPRRPLA